VGNSLDRLAALGLGKAIANKGKGYIPHLLGRKEPIQKSRRNSGGKKKEKKRGKEETDRYSRGSRAIRVGGMVQPRRPLVKHQKILEKPILASN